MLIKKTRKEKKKRGEDIPECGGEKELRREKKKKEKKRCWSKTFLNVEEKRRSWGEKRRERKGCWCFLHKGKKKRPVCCEMRDSSLFIEVFYRRF